MATITESWAWVGSGTWPGFDQVDQSNLDALGNGLSVDPDGYSVITFFDGDSDGAINDADTDDGSAAGSDRVIINGEEKTVAEVARYSDSIMVVNGVPQTVPVAVWLFTDGTYMVRINDADIPPGTHYEAVDSLTLGTWSETEYSGSWVAMRSAPFICFAAGTLISTVDGAVPVERLRPGDRVMTADHGLSRVAWTGQRRVRGRGAAAPVVIRAGALGNARDLVVSQQHRMLVGGWRAELLYGATEVLVAAIHLVNDDTIRIKPCNAVTYVHIMFDRHEIIFAEGIPSESFYPGCNALDRVSAATRAEILTLFPELDTDPARYGGTARMVLSAHQARVLGAGLRGA